MVLQAGVETRSAMAFYVDLADSTASADKAYADAEPTVWRMDGWSFLDRWRKTWQEAAIAPSDDAGRTAAQWLKAAYAGCTRDCWNSQRPSGPSAEAN